MSPAPRFSIILPTHNRADVLPWAIRSILAQTITNFELFIVGDGCTDKTADVVRSFSDPRIIWLDLPKAIGFGYANRNVAIRQARGEFIAHAAHDDLWFPDHLQLLGAQLTQPGMELVYSRPLWVIPRGMIAPVNFDLADPTTLHAFIHQKQSAIPSACVAHRRDSLDKVGVFSETLKEQGDRDLWARIINSSPQPNCACLPQPTCLHFRAHWRVHQDQVLKHEIIWEYLHTYENLPSSLRIPVADDQSEQAAAWDIISGNLEDWPTRLRDAIAATDRAVKIDWLLSKTARRRWTWPLVHTTRALFGRAHFEEIKKG
ncbi:MAG TPA: glycosyltransferase family A protein [Phycisphaerae bacterium]|jgi:glycosyltransferase involved in cell wall biosynthesis